MGARKIKCAPIFLGRATFSLKSGISRRRVLLFRQVRIQRLRLGRWSTPFTEFFYMDNANHTPLRECQNIPGPHRLRRFQDPGFRSVGHGRR